MKNGPAQKSFSGDDPYRYYGQYGDGWAKLHKYAIKNKCPKER